MARPKSSPWRRPWRESTPETISYIEAHGTGTALGDPIEIAGLTQAFRAGTAANGFCGIGSVKTNIGHLDAAAGVAGLIKTALALNSGAAGLSPFPGPEPEARSGPHAVPRGHPRQAWPGHTPRRAGVSSFGVGGTNAHVVLEEAPPVVPGAASDGSSCCCFQPDRRGARERDAATCVLPGRASGVDLGSVAYTLQVGRRRFGHRRALVCSDRDDALNVLRTPAPSGSWMTIGSARDPAIAFMFPGQGAQYVGMTRELYDRVPYFKTQVSECAEVLLPHLGHDLRNILYPDPAHTAIAEQQLIQTAMTQPVLFVVEYAMAQLWMKWGVQPTAMVGHSLGEYVAACLAGVFSRDDALVLLAAGSAHARGPARSDARGPVPPRRRVCCWASIFRWRPSTGLR